MRGFGGATLRGGQTVLHGLRMWGQIVRAALCLCAVLVIAVPAWNLWRHTDAEHWYAAAVLVMAEAKLAIGYGPADLQTVRRADGTRAPMALHAIAAAPNAVRARRVIRDQALAGAALGARIAAVSVLAFLVWFRYRGRALKRRRRVRGAELVSARRLRDRVLPRSERARRVLAASEPRPWAIAGVPWPDRAETQHTIVSGTTGSGKTVLIAGLVEQIRERNERGVIYDKMGSYTEAFYDPERDVLLNPLDARSPRWSPFLEARSPRDFDTMAAALIPQQKDAVDPFWVTAARQLFANGATVLWRKGETRNRELVRHLLKTELNELAEAMEGTVAQSIVDPENPKTALSVRAMLTAHIGAMEYLPDTGEGFSIRDWIERDDGDGGFLFLTSRGDQHASLRGLISTWLEIAVNALLSLSRSDERRVWTILDELPTLHQVPSLQPGLAESRQFGGCFVLGVQVASALRDLYGRNGAETVSGLCGTRVVLAAPDRDTAQWSADSLGRGEVEEVAEGVSYGANTIRDGVSLTPRRELRALALPSEIMRLPNLRGYLKLPGPFPVAEIQLRYKKRPIAAERFIPRNEDEEADEATGAPGDAASCEPGGAGERARPDADTNDRRTPRADVVDAGAHPKAVEPERAPRERAAPEKPAPRATVDRMEAGERTPGEKPATAPDDAGPDRPGDEPKPRPEHDFY